MNQCDNLMNDNSSDSDSSNDSSDDDSICFWRYIAKEFIYSDGVDNTESVHIYSDYLYGERGYGYFTAQFIADCAANSIAPEFNSSRDMQPHCIQFDIVDREKYSNFLKAHGITSETKLCDRHEMFSGCVRDGWPEDRVALAIREFP